MGITMFLQFKLNPTPPGPDPGQDLRLDAADLHLHAGLFPAGLVIYWTWNNLLSIAQQVSSRGWTLRQSRRSPVAAPSRPRRRRGDLRRAC
jgi:YidC/Oxa1 family membrane protein insertase